MTQIKFKGNIENINTIFRFDDKDINILGTSTISKKFNLNTGRVELLILNNNSLIDLDKNILINRNNITLNLKGDVSKIELDPINDLLQRGYNSGVFQVKYNFFQDIISNLYISEISPDRTELELSSTEGDIPEIESITNYFLTPGYYLLDLNISYNPLIVDIYNNKGKLYVKLYETLPLYIEEKDLCGVVDELINSRLIEIEFEQLIESINNNKKLRSPNFNISIPSSNNKSTSYYNYSSLLENGVFGESLNQISSLLKRKEIQINVEYNNFEDFIRFSSAVKRINLFVDKVKLIEEIQSNINSLLLSNSITRANEIENLQKEIKEITSNFDGYEYFLYFENQVTSYPKISTTKPYELVPTNSTMFSTWYNNLISSAQLYDEKNDEKLEYSIPAYIRENEINAPYINFVDMIGHYFDNIWIHLKSITDLYKNENKIDEGISKDLVVYALESFGINLYNDEGNIDIDKFLVGDNLGNENDPNNISKQDIIGELFKRIYHNIPMLFKSKGTTSGIEFILNIFGISPDILSVNELGGEFIGIDQNNINKIIIDDGQIIGNTLSSSSTIFRDYNKYPSSNRVDISFSPQNNIDKIIKDNINLNNPSLENIDDYLGDPRYLNENRYIGLEDLRKQIIKSEFSKFFDYSGFISLISFFDNTMFRMIEDFIPSRSFLTKGITFRTQHLERIKIKPPTASIENLNIGDLIIKGPSISHDNSYNIDEDLYFKGILKETNSINVQKIFNYYNKNPYLIKENVDLTSFFNSKFDTNWSKTVTRKSIFKIRNEKGIDTIPSETQDHNNTGFINSRYNGVVLLGQEYNKFTSGDISRGQEPVINNNSIYLGLFTSIKDIKYFKNNKRNNIALKYLVNKDGDIIELNQQNKHIFDVQNIFKKYDYLTISLFDSQKYSNQFLLNGEKEIIESGIYYMPIIYYNRNTSQLNFITLDYKDSIYNEARFSYPNSNLGEGNYPLNSNNIIPNIFDNKLEGNDYFPGLSSGEQITEISRFIASSENNYQISINLEPTITSNSISSNPNFFTRNGGILQYSLSVFRFKDEQISINQITNNIDPNSLLSTKIQTYVLSEGLKVNNILNDERIFLKDGISLLAPSISTFPANQTGLNQYFNRINLVKISSGSIVASANRVGAGGLFNRDFWVDITIKATFSRIEGGEILRLRFKEGTDSNKCQIDLFVQVDHEMVRLNTDLASRVAALAEKVVSELNKYGVENPPYVYPQATLDIRKSRPPYISEIGGNTFTIKFTIDDDGNSPFRYDKSGFYAMEYKVQPSDSITLNYDILDENTQEILIERGTTLYQYNQLLNVDLLNSTHNQITFWSKSPEISLKYGANDEVNGETYYADVFPNLISQPGYRAKGNIMYYKYLYTTIDQLSDVYLLPSNLKDINNYPNIGNFVNNGNIWNFNTDINVFLQENEHILFILKEENKSTGFDYSMKGRGDLSILKILDNPNLIDVIDPRNSGFLAPISKQVRDIDNNFKTIVMSKEFTNIYLKDGVFFDPGRNNEEFEPGTLYDKYGDVDVELLIQAGDDLYIIDRNDIPFEYRIIKVEVLGIDEENEDPTLYDLYKDGPYLVIHLNKSIPSQMIENILNLLPNKLEYEILFLKKKLDETNIIIKSNKRPGETSYGFIIPSNVDSGIMENINEITREIKQKLIENGSLDGGTFI